jgi:hypothetical protein
MTRLFFGFSCLLWLLFIDAMHAARKEFQKESVKSQPIPSRTRSSNRRGVMMASLTTSEVASQVAKEPTLK